MIAEHHRSLYRLRRSGGGARRLVAGRAAFLAAGRASSMADHALRRRPRPPQVTGNLDRHAEVLHRYARAQARARYRPSAAGAFG
jgi:hypothetical protein